MITKDQLLKLGFSQKQVTVNEDEFSYQVLNYLKNNSEIEVTLEYDLHFNLTKQYYEFSEITLKGNEITDASLRLLQSLM